MTDVADFFELVHLTGPFVPAPDVKVRGYLGHSSSAYPHPAFPADQGLIQGGELVRAILALIQEMKIHVP